MTEIGPLRLTVGGLAELAARCDAKTPAALADTIRTLCPDTARHLLTALLRPSGNEAEVARLTDQQVADHMPAASQCIVTALS